MRQLNRSTLVRSCSSRLPWPRISWSHLTESSLSFPHVHAPVVAPCCPWPSSQHATGTRRRSGPALSKPVMYRAVGAKVWTTSASLTAAALELGVSLSAASQACHRQKRLKGYELRATELREPERSGEEWRAMRCPVSHQEVHGRMVSSLGRLRTRSGLIHKGCVSSAYPVTRYKTGFGFRNSCFFFGASTQLR